MKCPLCDDNQASVLYEKTRSGRVVRCDRCGFVYSKKPKEKSTQNSLPAVVDSVDIYIRNARDRLKRLADSTVIKNGKLLDVGCFNGTFAAAAKQLGFDVYGVEVVSEAAEIAKKEHGIEVVVGDFEDVKIPFSPFRVISFIHSFEHLNNPRRILRRCRNLLCDGGALLIEMPNFDSWSRKLLGSKWRQFIEDHSLFYSPSTLGTLLNSEGFDIVFVEAVPKIMTFRLFADRIGRYYSQTAGKFIRKTMAEFGFLEKSFSLNLGDILLAIAVKQTKRD